MFRFCLIDITLHSIVPFKKLFNIGFYFLALENIDLKINIVSISDTILHSDTKLKVSKVIYSDPYFVVNYNLQNEI